MPSTFQILYFASASAYTGKSSESLPAPLPLSQLFPLLEDRYPGITDKVLSSCSVSVGLEYVDLPATASTSAGPGLGAGAGTSTGIEDPVVDRVIGEGEEVAIIPPVSSG